MNAKELLDLACKPPEKTVSTVAGELKVRGMTGRERDQLVSAWSDDKMSMTDRLRQRSEIAAACIMNGDGSPLLDEEERAHFAAQAVPAVMDAVWSAVQEQSGLEAEDEGKVLSGGRGTD